MNPIILDEQPKTSIERDNEVWSKAYRQGFEDGKRFGFIGGLIDGIGEVKADNAACVKCAIFQQEINSDLCAICADTPPVEPLPESEELDKAFERIENQPYFQRTLAKETKPEWCGNIKI